jgi:hypothetical protein
MDPVLGRVVVKRQQLVEVIGDLGGGLGELRSVGGLECPGGGAGVRLVFGAPDLGEGLLRAGVRGLGQGGQDVRCLVELMPTSA